MVKWVSIKTKKINRIGYNKGVRSLYIDFIGSSTDTTFIKVPEALFEYFIAAKSPDYFFTQFIDGYFDVASIDLNNSISAKFPIAI